MPTADVNVFISYSHDSPQHAERVLGLAYHRYADCISAMIDQYSDRTRRLATMGSIAESRHEILVS